MQILILYAATAGIFLILDAIMLRLVIAPLFRAHLGEALLTDIRLGAAAAFYLAYVAGLVWLISLPALRAGLPLQALVQGAVVGAMAYGTYEFTNYATLRGWHPAMVATDLLWGTAVTAFAAWAGVMVTRAIAG